MKDVPDLNGWQISVTPAELAQFRFGNPDAAHDELIKDGMCICKIRPIEEFLKDTKSILVGDKGTGKTGVFELLRERKLTFEAPRGIKQKFVPINQQLDYRALKERIISNIVSKVSDEALKYQVVWEILILYSMLERIKAAEGELPQQLQRNVKDFEDAFPLDYAKPGLLEIFFSSKKKIGIKIEASPTSGLPTADLYAQFGGERISQSTAETPNLLRLGQLRQSINNHLASVRTRVYVLIDRIDEFLIKEEYEIQRLALQGLIGCERSYRPYHNIRLRVFLRRDLFERIDFREFGADKVMFDSLELVWTAEDIRDFLSKRILHNYLRVFDLESFVLMRGDELFYVDRQSTQFVRQETASPLTKFERFFVRVVRRVRRFIDHRILRKPLDPWNPRHINLTDAISTEIIQTFFPEEVWRADPLAQKKTITITEFLSTHFNLSSGKTTPRIILMFAQSCIDCAVNFFQKNPDLAGAKPFPILTSDIVEQAYRDFKARLWEIMAAEGKQWRNDIQAFRGNFAAIGGMSFDQVQEAFPQKSDAELRGFLAVLQHLGIIACVNKEFALEQRYYQLPILFREGDSH
jgi:hypothetical protein